MPLGKVIEGAPKGELDHGQIVQALRDLGMSGVERLLTILQRLLVQGLGFGVAAKEIDRNGQIVESFCETVIIRMEALLAQLQRTAMQRLRLRAIRRARIACERACCRSPSR